MTPLEATPNQVREFLDDTDAKTLLIQFGLLDKLLEFGRQPGLAEPRADTIHYTDHATHWIIGIRYRGYASADQNGYAVTCLPKSVYSFDQFRAFERDRLRGVPIDLEESGWLRPPQN
jgi:hypothetical protein